MPRVTITVPEKNSQPYRFQLDRQIVTMGRGSENDIVIDSGSVSVSHAEMRRIEGGYELRDAGSTNGIKLNGLRQEVIPLHDGATVHIGDVAFDFSLAEEEREALMREKPIEPTPITREPELPARKPPAHRGSYRPAASVGSGFGATFLFLIFALAAFYTGLAVRYQKDTGKSFFQAIKLNTAAKAAPVAPVAPAAPAAPPNNP